MKKSTLFLIMVCLIGASWSTIHAKEIRPTQDIDAIYTAITDAEAGDVIILERGGYYFSTVTLNVNVNLTIKADEATTGNNPIVALMKKEDETIDREMMFVRADLVCENIYFHGGLSGKEAHDDVKRGIVWTETANMTASFDGCYFEDFDARTLQLEAPDMTFTAKNCIWMDDHKTVGPTEGRSIDFRQYGPDEVLIQNCTFVNVGNRWFRHSAAAGLIDPINSLVIDHCTFLNAGGFHPAFDFGTIEKLQFTNNIVGNPGIMGSDFVRRPSSNGGAFIIATPDQYYSTESAERPYRLSEEWYDRADGIVVLACHGIDSIGTEITMNNNNMFMDQKIIDKIATNDTLSEAAWMCGQFEDALVGTKDEAFDNEKLSFVEAPAVPVDLIMDSYIAYWDKSQYFEMYYSAADSIDLSYGTEAVAYTGAEDGFPLGDLNWYPELKAAWENGGLPPSANHTVLATDFSLQNYPNPFVESTTVQFKLNNSAVVSFTLYNAVGSKVQSIDPQQYNQGINNINLNRGNLEPGIYFLQLSTKDVSETKRLIVE